MSDSGGTWALGILLFRRGLVWVRGLGRVRTLPECGLWLAQWRGYRGCQWSMAQALPGLSLPLGVYQGIVL